METEQLIVLFTAAKVQQTNDARITTNIMIKVKATRIKLSKIDVVL